MNYKNIYQIQKFNNKHKTINNNNINNFNQKNRQLVENNSIKQSLISKQFQLSLNNSSSFQTKLELISNHQLILTNTINHRLIYIFFIFFSIFSNFTGFCFNLMMNSLRPNLKILCTQISRIFLITIIFNHHNSM